MSREGSPLGSRLTIAKRELATLKSEKTIVLALVIQLFVAAFSSFLVVGLVSLYDPSGAEGQTVSVGVAGEQRNDLVAIANQQDGVQPIVYDSAADVREGYRNRAIDAALITNQRSDGTIGVEVIAPDAGVESTLVVVSLQETLLEYERYERDQRSQFLDEQPLGVPEAPAGNSYYGFTYTVLVPLLILLPVFISGSLAVDAVTEELERGTLELLAVAPIELREIVDGKLLAAAGLAPVQAALWLVLLEFNGTSVANAPALIAVSGALALAVVSMGIGLALVTADRRQAQFLYSFGILTIAGVTTLLPEHPLNTIAKLAIDSPTATTWTAVVGYLCIGLVALVVVQFAVPRIDVDRLLGSA
ncbi:ABC-type Na+ efflux pump, permease component [Natronoarchaeum philippinense]|uniref:ABC-type Na+ efflux pump, permease component n=1 Tax=Natronoarchaeum philippinense TaxID=558529 RepID=A0A285NA36_NATPI|nr:ABC transporter permease [Natronoarchaeum philippinense]SNZ04541.1 ABC-type Na+ efflux pump, permease component [Natronoarchaeum philippinense]